MNRFKSTFNINKKCSLIAMVHLDALPGSPRFKGCIQKIVDKALRQTETYLNCNVDGILVENMNDIPYVQSKHIKPETTASMARVCTEIRKLVNKNIPCGVQVLAAGNEQALAVAQATDFNFIRVEGFVFSHIADEGFIDSIAGQLLRYRKNIGAEDVLILTDIKKKHSSHAITSDVSLIETAKAAEFFLSDGVILTGSATGHAADVKELQQLKQNVSLPVIVGSGVTVDNLQNYMSADALIVGSHFKKHEHWMNDINEKSVEKFMKKIQTFNGIK